MGADHGDAFELPDVAPIRKMNTLPAEPINIDYAHFL
ncbi:hypothetical protein DESC_720454 [Desulfosarcina cetonica]|nr:hypothetical protein DESC_720454 [Desulfosarcina cetonica]